MAVSESDELQSMEEEVARLEAQAQPEPVEQEEEQLSPEDE